MRIVNYLSFDVEEYFHAFDYGDIALEEWHQCERRLPDNMEKLLCILGGKHKATFFFLGWVAAEYPEIVKRVHAAGHEIGCHGHLHRCIWDQTPEEFRSDVVCAKETIEDVIGEDVLGYRAPTFSITNKTLWALDILREAGFVYDSSIFPIYHDRYGIPDAPRSPYRLRNGLWEIPMSTVRCLGWNVPFGGGGYFRLYPYWLTKLLADLRNRNGAPFVFYQHPWELDSQRVEAPRGVLGRMRLNTVIGSAEDKLRRLLAEYRFFPLKTFLEL